LKIKKIEAVSKNPAVKIIRDILNAFFPLTFVEPVLSKVGEE
jgi:hypothetical protein